MDSKKVLEKLVKIANNQQKIINKLAQSLPAMPTGGASGDWENVNQAVANAVKSVADAHKASGFGVQEALIGPQTGLLEAKITHPMNMDPALYRAVSEAVKQALLAGGHITTDTGKKVPVSKVELTGVMV